MNALISHPTANANVRAIANGMAGEGKLQSFYTSLACFPGSMLDQVARLPGCSELKRRNFKASLSPFTHTYPWYELARMLSERSGISSLTAHERGAFCVDEVYHRFDNYVADRLTRRVSKGLTMVYAYEDGALETFTQAKRLGLTCVYDLPIAYWKTTRRLLHEEAQRLPQWAATLEGGIIDSEQKTLRKTKELELADIVVTPGSFVADSLQGFTQDKKVIISAFGSPEPGRIFHKTKLSNRRLRVLFAGRMGQRKGLADLFEAIKLLNTSQVELVVLGSTLVDLSFYKKQLPGFTYEPTRSHDQVLKLMSECDVFCLPSIVEGRALVLQEAMSQGLPLLITPNTGGQDLIIEGETGFLVPIRSPNQIAEKLQWFIDHKDQIPQMSLNARKHAAQYTWDNYAARIISEIENFSCLKR